MEKKKCRGVFQRRFCDGPKGGEQEARHKKMQGAFSNIADDGPKGTCRKQDIKKQADKPPVFLNVCNATCD
ncbi:hypothetical protein ACIPSR_06305 [Pectobacterium sp. CHL-2024]|uniref:hypothetical protein n=1 Tax=Pectobacterium TaxID=122277 RepID=UPI000C1BF325|nr:hypothetical protein [Pectobacterium brasiliense]ATV43634.1 hypothetical protein CTV95_09275 [Pectobacterium brasiliense]MBA0209365.1 hypothetical protein [Pectobacterium brasiliense]MCA6981766.1 hypothetical protein [Pectobacterium brasiliense]MCH4991322.1 hypothetical protein [Pectobacterium brasiliense]